MAIANTEPAQPSSAAYNSTFAPAARASSIQFRGGTRDSAADGSTVKTSVPPITWPSLDRAFQCTSLRPGASCGFASVKLNALPSGANPSLRGSCPATTTVTDVSCAMCSKATSMTAGDCLSTASLAGTVDLIVVWAVASEVSIDSSTTNVARPA